MSLMQFDAGSYPHPVITSYTNNNPFSSMTPELDDVRQVMMHFRLGSDPFDFETGRAGVWRIDIVWLTMARLNILSPMGFNILPIRKIEH